MGAGVSHPRVMLGSGTAAGILSPGTPSNAESTDSNATAPSPPRYDELADCYEAILNIAVINDWLLTSL